MRKTLKIMLLTIGALVAVPALVLATTSIVNVFATRAEMEAIVPYGRLIPVDGRQMNVVDSGTSGETIVLLPGLGTAAPGWDFAPLISALDDTNRVIAIEPFGTGLSDQTDSPRTATNIAREVHDALRYLGVDRYVLMGHSIAGIYALEYSKSHADELIAFVGIDSSVPDQPGWDDPVSIEGLETLRSLGILRVLSAVAADPYAGSDHDEPAKEQMRLLSTRNGTAPTMLDEAQRASANFASVSGATFPAALPVLLFVAGGDTAVTGWLDLHERQAASVDRAQVVVLDGGHYLHHSQSPEIARSTAAFLASRSVR